MPDDFLGSTGTSGVVAVNGLASTGTINSDVFQDSDWFRVVLTAGVNYTINLNFGPFSSLDPFVELRNSLGTLFLSDDDAGVGVNSLLSYTPSLTGTYYVAARAYNHASTGSYSLTVTAPDDIAQNASTLAFVNVGGLAAAGTINFWGDQDWFEVSLAAGVPYQLRMTRGTLSDPYLELRNSAGTVIAVNDDDLSVPGGTLNSLIVYTPTVTGTYYLDAAEFGDNATGTYTVSANTADDYAATIFTSGTVTVNQDTLPNPDGRLEVLGDQDWFAVFLNANVNYVMRLTGTTGGLADPYLELRNSGGSIVAFNDDGSGLNSLLNFTPTVSGTYYLAARAYSNAYVGAYDVSVDAADDFPFHTGTTGRVYVNDTPSSGRIEVSGDLDAFLVTLSAGTQYQFRLNSVAPGPLTDPYLVLYPGAGGAAIVWNDDGGGGVNSLINFTPVTSGNYFLGAMDFNQNVVGGGTGAYTISATTADDYADHTGTAGAVVAGGAFVTGRVNTPGDQDWFAINLVAGHTYTLNLTGASSGHGTLSDPYLRGIYDSVGNLIGGTANDDYGGSLNSRVTFQAPTSGEYFVSAGAYANHIGTYRLDVDGLAAPTDILASTATGASLAIGATARSTIGSIGDVDWFRVSLTGGTRYVVEENADFTAGTPLFDPYFRGVYTAGGVLLPGTSNDDFGISLNSRVSFIAPNSGTFYLAAGAFSTNQGAYGLRFTRADATISDTVGATTATAGVVAVNGHVNGNIGFARDIDWYRVTLAAGQDYAIDVRGQPSGNGTLADPNLIGIYNSAGAIIPGTGADDGPGTLESVSTFSPATAGAYYLAVGANNDGTGTYRLSVETVAEILDIPANATTAVRGIIGGGLTSAIDSAGDVDWIRVSLTAGVTYRIEQRAMPTNEGTLSDPRILGVYRSGQAMPGSADDSSGVGANALVNLTAPTSTDYFIAASAFGSGTGTYQTWVRPSPDQTAPVLQSVLPTDGASSVSVSTNLSLVFNEAVRAGTGNVVITGGGQTRNIAVTSPQVSFNGEVMTINPTTNLSPGTAYTVTMAPGVVEDIADNPFGGITTNTRFNFTTAATNAADRWTIMVYMAADNDLEPAAIADLNEMESATLPSNVNVVVMVDRAPGYNASNNNWTDTRRGLITHDNNLATVSSNLASIGEQNMGSPATLTNFINWAASNHPAQRYGLVIWDHGGGISGTSWDITSGGNLTNAELRTGVDNSNVARFDLIGFDACYQGLVEQMWDVRNLASVVVASEDVEPGDGWEYDRFLPQLAANPDMTAANLASAIVTTYGQRYAGLENITLSAVRTEALPALDIAIDAFVAAVGAAPSATILNALRTAAAHSTLLGSETLHYRDLGDFMDEVVNFVDNTAIDNAARAVATAVDNAVIARAGTSADAQGLSIYLPFSRDTVDSTYTAANHSFLASSNWDSFLALI